MVVEKPAGILVHPPLGENRRAVPPKTPDMIRILRTQLGAKVYPVHRLDRSTSGVMVFALSSEIAAKLQAQFQSGEARKTYLALCRGFVPDQGVIDSPLRDEEPGAVEKAAKTIFECLFRFELPIPSGRFESSRFSLAKVEIETGRWHQIRRHLKRISHPLIGDTVHGDGLQNRIWREITGEAKLYLLAWHLTFTHPLTGRALGFRARYSNSWHRVFDRCGYCPLLTQ